MCKFLFTSICVFISFSLFGQEIKYLQSQIDSLIVEGDYKKLVPISSIQKRLVDLQHYKIIYAEHGNHEDKLIRILAYQSIRKIQYFLYKNNRFDEARDLYVQATNKLILEYANDIDALNRIEVIPSARLLIWPRLKLAIEQAGGEWEKGEITYPPIEGVPLRGNLIPEDNQNNN